MLVRRVASGLFGGLWELPQAEGRATASVTAKIASQLAALYLAK